MGVYEDEYGKYEAPDVDVNDSSEWWFDRGAAYVELGYSALVEIPYKKALDPYDYVPGIELERAECMSDRDLPAERV